MNINVAISGITPLLMNRFTEEAQIKASNGTTAAAIGKKGTPREQAEPKAYKFENGTLYIPGANLFAAIVAAGKYHKTGRSKITTMRSSLVPAGVNLLEPELSLKTKDFEVDSRSVVIPATGGRVMCHRPRLDKWGLSFTLEVDEAMFDPALVRTLVDDAGKKVGLGDYRPDRKGPFGRFVVSSWKEASA